MQEADKRIVSCALTGSIHTPSMSSALPVTSADLIEQGLAAVAAGASILHLHAREDSGRPTASPEVFEKFVRPLSEQCDAIINITTGGSTQMTIDERLAAARLLAPEVASLNMGSMNFVYAGAAKPGIDWKYDWEQSYLLNSARVPFTNTFEQIETALRELGRGLGIRFEFECYDIGHLYTLAHFRDRGLVEGPILIQGVFGILGGIGAHHENLDHMVRIADRLFGSDYQFSAFAAGRHQMNFITHAALAGGHVRVGLEDNLYIAKGRLARDNAEQVSKAVRILDELGLEVATPDEARQMLGLKAK
ncbi:BKACE family enzyme [Amycolatopsis silviterrae]|uniref:3-keto-5-aminohexanoate cleavage protein n=1 Tax=Amycolatopsis silviterrae TaxID=1656914 RepID=A0ABW5HJV7_9PSEU